MQQLLCDNANCGLLIQDGTERIDVTVPPRTDPLSNEPIPGGAYNFHLGCYSQQGPLTPAPGVSVVVTHVAGLPPAPAPAPAPAMPAPLRAPGV